jgi:hypothetical protein
MAWVAALLGVLLLLFSSYLLFALLLLLLGAISGAFAYWRIRFFRAILKHATETRGQIVAANRSLFARRGRYIYRISYTYRYQGQDYRGTSSVTLVAAAPVVQPGERVAVLVNRQQPQRALIPALYLP